MQPCLGLGPWRDNSVGTLLQDYAELAGLFAVCMQRHNDFVTYMAPLVAKEKAK